MAFPIVLHTHSRTLDILRSRIVQSSQNKSESESLSCEEKANQISSIQAVNLNLAVF